MYVGTLKIVQKLSVLIIFYESWPPYLEGALIKPNDQVYEAHSLMVEYCTLVRPDMVTGMSNICSDLAGCIAWYWRARTVFSLVPWKTTESFLDSYLILVKYILHVYRIFTEFQINYVLKTP